MFEILVASGTAPITRRPRWRTGGLAALLAHALLVWAVVGITNGRALADPSPVSGILIAPWPSPSSTPSVALPVWGGEGEEALRLPDPPGEVRTTIEPVDLGVRFDPKLSARAIGGMASPGGGVPASGGVWPAGLVEELPVLLAGPQLAYPEPLRRAGIAGQVVVEAVIDSTGRVESGSLRVVQTTNDGFASAAKEYVLRALFRPARLRGRPVRVLIRLPVEFRIGA